MWFKIKLRRFWHRLVFELPDKKGFTEFKDSMHTIVKVLTCIGAVLSTLFTVYTIPSEYETQAISTATQINNFILENPEKNVLHECRDKLSNCTINITETGYKMSYSLHKNCTAIAPSLVTYITFYNNNDVPEIRTQWDNSKNYKTALIFNASIYTALIAVCIYIFGLIICAIIYYLTESIHAINKVVKSLR